MGAEDANKSYTSVYNEDKNNDEKPDDETRQKLKERGFRWSPRYNAWQRKLTDNAMYDARRALGLTE